MRDCRLVLSRMVLSLLLAISGCSRTPCYKGYVPATEEDALAFAQELMDRHERGDDSWFYSPSLEEMRGPEFVKAVGAGYYFQGLDVPNFPHIPAATDEEIEASAARTTDALGEISGISFEGVEPKEGTYCVCFECLYKGEKYVQRLKFVKHKKSGRFVVLGSMMSPL
ncbi:MAG: hypothetical protein IKE64_01345 [Thermoguttaceae bacterium]|nr:hypothetical protein [Thermoguttaceae bacterium]